MEKVPELLHKPKKKLHTQIYIVRVRKMELKWFLGVNFYFAKSNYGSSLSKSDYKFIAVATTLYNPKLCYGLETYKRSYLRTQSFLHVVDS